MSALLKVGIDSPVILKTRGPVTLAGQKSQEVLRTRGPVTLCAQPQITLLKVAKPGADGADGPKEIFIGGDAPVLDHDALWFEEEELAGISGFWLNLVRATV